MKRPLDLLESRVLPVHILAEQEFCELKVDYELRNPRVNDIIAATPALALHNEKREAGLRLHAALARGAVPVTRDVAFAALRHCSWPSGRFVASIGRLRWPVSPT